MGAEALAKLLAEIDLDKLSAEIEKDLEWNDKVTYEVPNVI